MEREEIKEYLPHREPMLLVDRMDKDENGVVHGEYLVRGDEHFLQGHFPGIPVVPGVILCEILGQCSSMLLLEELKGGKITLYTGLDKVRFKNTVRPGDTVKVEAVLTNRRANMFFIDAKGYVDGKLCVSGVLSVALVDNSKMI